MSSILVFTRLDGTRLAIDRYAFNSIREELNGSVKLIRVFYTRGDESQDALIQESFDGVLEQIRAIDDPLGVQKCATSSS